MISSYQIPRWAWLLASTWPLASPWLFYPIREIGSALSELWGPLLASGACWTSCSGAWAFLSWLGSEQRSLSWGSTSEEVASYRWPRSSSRSILWASALCLASSSYCIRCLPSSLHCEHSTTLGSWPPADPADDEGRRCPKISSTSFPGFGLIVIFAF